MNKDYRFHDTCPKCGAESEVAVCPKCNYCCGVTQVFSRVTGFYQPVSNFNKGKTEEYKDRKVYKAPEVKDAPT